MGKMKAAELRTKNADELNRELIGLRREQFNLRMQRGAGQLANPMRFLTPCAGTSRASRPS